MQNRAPTLEPLIVPPATKAENVRRRDAPKPFPTAAEDKHQALRNVLALHQRRRMQCLVGIALAAFAFVVLAWVFTADDEMPMDDDLYPETSANPSASSPRAPDLLKLALESAVAVKSENLSGKPVWTWDTQSLQNIVRTNAVALDNLRDLASQSDWSPQHTIWTLEDIGSNAKWDELRQAKAASISYYARLNDHEGAMQAALELATLARRMQSITAWPTFYARGIELHELACESLADLLRTTHLTARKLAMFQAEFEKLAPSDTLLRDALAHYYSFERQFVLDADARAKTSSAHHVPRLFYKPHQTVEVFAKAFRALRIEVIKPISGRTDAVTPVVGAQGSPLTTILSPNRSGMMHANQRVWPYAALVERQGLQSARHLLVLTAFAIRRYAIDYTALPKTLSDLIPDYFNELPKDPFDVTGEALHYNAQRGVLYSVGQDYIDSGGHLGTTPLGDSYEPTVSVK